jgi:serine/threonine protein kinase
LQFFEFKTPRNFKSCFTASRNSYSEIGIKLFLEEGVIMNEFNHPNVLKSRGICFFEDDLPMILLPFMEKGDLLSYIRDTDNFLTIRDLLIFGLGIARGKI